MRSQSPTIAGPTHRWSRLHSGHSVGGIGLRRRSLNQKIDLGYRKPGDVQFQMERGELAQSLAQKKGVPTRQFAEPVVCNRECFRLLGCQVLKTDRWPLEYPELPPRQQPAMPGDDLEIGINDDRDIEAELFDRTSDLPDLLFAVLSRIARIEFQSISRLVNNSR